jgi:hypothetical protein
LKADTQAIKVMDSEEFAEPRKNLWKYKTCEINAYVKVMDSEEFTDLRKNSWKKLKLGKKYQNSWKKLKLVKTLKLMDSEEFAKPRKNLWKHYYITLSYGLFKRIC